MSDTTATVEDTSAQAADTASTQTQDTTAATSDTTKATDTSSQAADTSATPETTQAKDWFADLELAKDEKVAKRLQRYGTQEDAIKAGLAAQDKLRESGRIKLPGENATDEEKAEFYEAIGAKGKLEEYGDLTPELPEGMEFSDANRAMLTALAEKAYEKGGMLRSPDVIGFMKEAYGDVLQAQAAQMKEIAEEKQAEYSRQIDKMWGENRDLNSKLANEGVSRFFGDRFEEIRTAQLIGEDGQPMGRVGDHPAFLNAMMEAVRQSSDDLAFAVGNSESVNGMGIEQVQAEIDKIMHLYETDRQKYDRPEMQQKLKELRARKSRISQRQAA
ncbi:hypothetical protein [Henriciella pelagia]|uniref:hypothetical protein n=1 Tax=Henriciella pelagia TaxID=1977912 RepID=UPI0035150618